MTELSETTRPSASTSWQIWVDTGGTFTDCLALDPGGRLARCKILSNGTLRGRVKRWDGRRRALVDAEWISSGHAIRGATFRMLHRPDERVRIRAVSPEHGLLELDSDIAVPPQEDCRFEVSFAEEAPIVAARMITGTPAGERLPSLSMRLATTRGTNALLERSGDRPVLFITQGFRDLLRIGDQRRPDLFALTIERPQPLFDCVVEVPERVAAGGRVTEPLDLDALSPVVRQLVARGQRSAAIALMHSYAEPAHEARLEELLRGAGFEYVSSSAALAPFIGLLHRAETAVVDAYLSPVLSGYLKGVGDALGETGSADARGERADGESSRLLVMTSAGGLTRAVDFRAKDSLLSGPAGGVVGAALTARQAGFPRVIAFDMGGTSTDVARIEGDFEYVWEHEVGGARLVAPALAIESVAAGGGSICRLDGEGLRVGPESAGASPGPACYGVGGPLTLTDANLLLGRLKPARFGIPLDVSAAGTAAAALRDQVAQSQREPLSEASLLEGLVALADERMADAIREISLRKGYDPAEYALVAFGGAGPQHGCGVAERLGIRTVLIPPDAGLLSALGIGHAVLERFAERQLIAPLDVVEHGLAAWMRELEDEAAAAIRAEGYASSEVEIRRRIASLRFVGQESTLEIEYVQGRLFDSFRARYAEVYGHLPENRDVELVALRVAASTSPPAAAAAEEVPAYSAEAREHARTWLAGEWRELPCFERAELRAGAEFAGPALIWESHCATLVGIGWHANVLSSGVLRLQRAIGSSAESAAQDAPEAIREELFIHRFRSIVGEMGEQLRRTALSVNVRERLDYSCALLDAAGELVVNAPHIPVHLGALGVCVREVARSLDLAPDDVVMTNHPAVGGSHLPDITVLAPVHDQAGVLLGYVANRAHHAELGGIRPGSMPPNATRLIEEGVIIEPMYLVRDGHAEWLAAERLLRDGPHPSRAVDENLADLRAQVAAVKRGATLLRSLADRHGVAPLARYMAALTGRAERLVREALGRIPDGRYAAIQRLDDGSPLQVRIDVLGDSAVFDFAGSNDVHGGNLNATPAIVRSVVLYVVRLLCAEPLPLNEGLLRAVEIRVPSGILNPDFVGESAPAVVGGNVETSQRLVDTCLLALGIAACSQGTMNNVLFGDESFGYYETVGGGAGACPGSAGANAVHTHMTNTRITDPEVLEHRYPVRVERFGIRRGSGGAGRWKGGDGIIRELRFLRSLSLSLLTQHRKELPYGMAGGEPGAAGRQRVVRVSGEVVELAAIDGCDVHPGDRLVLETPGGGGWGGSAASREPAQPPESESP